MGKRRRRNKYFYLAVMMFTVFFMCVLLYYYSFLHQYQRFYLNSESVFKIINLQTDIVPQGIDYLDDEESFIVSGYEYPKGYSKIVVVDSEQNRFEKTIVNSKGKKFKWHSGGIACHGDFVYVTGGNRQCYVLDKNDLLNPDLSEVTIVGTIDTDNNSSFCFVYGNCLFVGEYQYRTKFVTDANHHLMSPHGNFNTAMVFAYPFSKTEKYGVSEQAIMALSIGSSIQGMCMDKQGRMYLSASSSNFDESILYVYDFRKVVQTVDSTIVQEDKAIPVFIFEDSALIDKLYVPPNAEGVTADRNSIYLLFESASKRFKYGWLFGTQYVYQINTRKLF